MSENNSNEGFLSRWSRRKREPEKAEDEDVKAQTKIEALAKEAGIEDDKLEDEELSWHDIVGMIREADGEYDSDDGEDPPAVGEVYGFKPPRARKPIEVTITSVNKSKETVALKGDNDKTYKDVSWEKLISE